MGLNAYLEAVGGVGVTAAASTALGAVVKIDGKPGKRLAITAFGFSDLTGVVVPVGYFMKSLRQTTATTTASGATTISCAAWSTAPATSGNIVAVLDNGTYQWLTVASTASTTSVPISSALTDTVATGNPLYYLGVYGTAGHYVVNGTTAAQKTGALELGMFYGATKGSPMMVTVIDATSTALCNIDYITYGYINI